MSLLAGTADGVYRTAVGSDAEPRQVLDCGAVYALATVDAERRGAIDGTAGDDHDADPADGHDAVLAGGESGLYCSTDGGESWSDLDLSEGAVHAVGTSPDGCRLYAGTSPPHVLRSDDGGGTWTRSAAFASAPGRADWQWGGNPGGGVDAVRVVSFGTHPDAPARVYAAVESVGVFRSEDYGETWRRTDDGLLADPHHFTVLGPETLVASTGDGLYRTDDGTTWRRLDTARELFWFSYVTETVQVDGALYAAAEDRAEYRSDEMDGARSVLLRSTDGGDSFEWFVPPGETRTAEIEGAVGEFVRAWSVVDGRPVGATRNGRLVHETPEGEWTTVGDLPATTYALATV